MSRERGQRDISTYRQVGKVGIGTRNRTHKVPSVVACKLSAPLDRVRALTGLAWLGSIRPDPSAEKPPRFLRLQVSITS